MKQEREKLPYTKQCPDFPYFREWQDIAVELTPTTRPPYTCGISKGELGNGSIAKLEEQGWQFPAGFRQRGLTASNPIGNAVFKMRSEDLLINLGELFDFIILGADKILNAQLQDNPLIPIGSPLGFGESKLCCLTRTDRFPETLEEFYERLASATITLDRNLEAAASCLFLDRYQTYRPELKNPFLLSGSLEAAPWLRPDEDVFVIDIVNTGTTAQANGLAVVDVVTDIPGAFLVTTKKRLKD